jgi:hypothetical protein
MAALGLAAFLKKYSAVPNAFIDELFGMYDGATIQTVPIVDLDHVAKWLSVQKFNLLKTIRASYKMDLDYTIERGVGGKRPAGGKYGGNNYVRVLLTPDCFKRLCMQTRSPRGEMVRTYFIELEALVVRYNQQLLSAIEADDAQLRKNMRPRDPADSTGYIYVIRASERMDSVYKIGRSKDLNRRLDEYQTGRADALEVIYKLRTQDLKGVEGCVHAWLKDHAYDGCVRRCKEVYKADIDLIKMVIGECDGIGRAKVEYARRKPTVMKGGYYVVLRKE